MLRILLWLAACSPAPGAPDGADTATVPIEPAASVGKPDPGEDLVSPRGDAEWPSPAASPGSAACPDAAGADHEPFVWYADLDHDGYGDPSAPLDACFRPLDHAIEAGDCDDADPAVHVGAAGSCNGHDDDCDGLVDLADPDEQLAAAWWPDGDGDGFGSGSAVTACTAPPGHVATAGDCDDSAANVHPGADERCADGLDADCDGVSTCDLDDPDGLILGSRREDWPGLAHWMGDVDGDGRDDLLAWQMGASPADEPNAAIFLGPVDDVRAFSDAAWTLDLAPWHGSLTPPRPLPAGDVDGDGWDDLWVLTDGNDEAPWREEQVYLVSGAPGDHGPEDSLALGAGGNAFDDVGDLDGDFLPELLVGAVREGHVRLLDAEGNVRLAIQRTEEFQVGESVLGTDLDGDGADELVVSAKDSTWTGESLVFQAGTGIVSVDDAMASLSLGAYSPAGDFTGDGHPDLWSGADALLAGAGDGTAVFELSLTEAEHVTPLGDLDGDGADDAALSSSKPGYYGGAVWLVPGGSSGRFDTAAVAPAFAGEPGDCAGWMLDGRGDTDGDGLRDLAIAIPGADGVVPDAGRVVVILGSSL